MGGLDPPTSLLPGCIPPPKRGGAWFLDFSWAAPSQRGKPKKGNPSGGVSRVVLPQMAPLILGLLGFAGSIPRFARIYSLLITSSIPVSLYRFLQIFRTFLGEYSYTTIISHGYMFFLR